MKPVPWIVLFEDDDYIAINKPPGLLSIPDRFDKNLPNALEMLRRSRDVLVVHRIDRQTSGVLIFAKNRDAHRSLCRAFEQHTVLKVYLAIVEGVVQNSAGTIDAPLRAHTTIAGAMMVDRHRGRPAVSRYEVIERYRSHTLLKVFPETGRQHQIRVHLKSVGHSLVVDDVYGHRSSLYLSEIKKNYKPKAGVPERPLISRLTLHSTALSFCHYRTGQTVLVESPAPKDFRSVIQQLRRASA